MAQKTKSGLYLEPHLAAEPHSRQDRPGWIPAEIGDDWDPSPYAYQTEEELMPAGGLHGQIINYISEVLRHYLAACGLMFLTDTFMLYRDPAGIKQRISPDLLLMPLRSLPPQSYDLDVESPPLCVIEVTSPDSRLTDFQAKQSFYFQLGIPTYLVIDVITPSGRPRPQIDLYGWRMEAGAIQPSTPNEFGGLLIPEMGLIVLAWGNQLRFIEAETGQPLLDMSQLSASLEEERTARQEAEQARQAEAAARQEAEAEIARLHAEIARLQAERDDPPGKENEN